MKMEYSRKGSEVSATISFQTVLKDEEGERSSLTVLARSLPQDLTEPSQRASSTPPLELDPLSAREGTTNNK